MGRRFRHKVEALFAPTAATHGAVQTGTEVERNGYVLGAAKKLGLTDAQLDALFDVAESVDFSDADGLIDHDDNATTPEVDAKGWWKSLLNAVGLGG